MRGSVLLCRWDGRRGLGKGKEMVWRNLQVCLLGGFLFYFRGGKDRRIGQTLCSFFLSFFFIIFFDHKNWRSGDGEEERVKRVVSWLVGH
jgi:hypothetical protein